MKTVTKCPVKACCFTYPSDGRCPVHGDDDQHDSMAAAIEQLGIDMASTPHGNTDSDSLTRTRKTTT